MYMALNLYFKPEASLRDLLTPLLDIPFLKIVSVVGCDELDWIIAGYDVEWEIRMPYGKKGSESSVQIASESGNDMQQDYLREMARLVDNADLPSTLGSSPFETVPPGYNFTQINSSVSIETFEKVIDWSAAHQTKTAILIQVCVKLAVKCGESSSEQWVYRSDRGYYGYDNTLLEIRVFRNKDGTKHVVLSTRSGIWLNDNFEDNLPTSKEDANANMAKFATLAKVIYSVNQAQYQDGFMDLEGHHFEAEREHISALLADVPRIAYVV
jgi:hypothetical protein